MRVRARIKARVRMIARVRMGIIVRLGVGIGTYRYLMTEVIVVESVSQ